MAIRTVVLWWYGLVYWMMYRYRTVLEFILNIKFSCSKATVYRNVGLLGEYHRYRYNFELLTRENVVSRRKVFNDEAGVEICLVSAISYPQIC
jgi:hypothetical protein